MSTAAAFRAEAAKRILVKDGAYGTFLTFGAVGPASSVARRAR